MEDDNYMSFGMSKLSDKINYLVYVDDTIIFTYVDFISLDMIKSTLHEYKRISGQKINVDTSFFYMH